MHGGVDTLLLRMSRRGKRHENDMGLSGLKLIIVSGRLVLMGSQLTKYWLLAHWNEGNRMTKKWTSTLVIARTIYFCLWPLFKLCPTINRLARWLLSVTSNEWFVLKKVGKLRFKIAARRRRPFLIDGTGLDLACLVWQGEEVNSAGLYRSANPRAVFSIPDDISLSDAQAILKAQHIDPWFAEELCKRIMEGK